MLNLTHLSFSGPVEISYFKSIESFGNCIFGFVTSMFCKHRLSDITNLMFASLSGTFNALITAFIQDGQGWMLYLGKNILMTIYLSVI